MPSNVRPAIRALLIDLSGTLHIGPKAIDGAVSAFQRLRALKIPIRFCSNSSKESTADVQKKLEDMGFEVKPGELWTSLGALKDVVKTKGLKKPYFILSDSAMKEFPDYTVTGCGSSQLHHTEYDSVVMGLSPDHLNYDVLTKAFRVLSSSPSSSKPLLTTHRAKYIRKPDGELSLGPGPFVKALEEAMGGSVLAEAVGKPGKAFFERVIESFDGSQLPESQGSNDEAKIVIIGDDIEADLGGAAVDLGLWRVLVKTGKYRDGDEKREGQHPPDEVQESFAAFVDTLNTERAHDDVSSMSSQL